MSGHPALAPGGTGYASPLGALFGGMILERVMPTENVIFVASDVTDMRTTEADLGTFGEHVERSEPPAHKGEDEFVIVTEDEYQQQLAELNDIRAITERETDPVRALRRRMLTEASKGLSEHILRVRTMLSEADTDDLPVADLSSIREPLADLFYEASRLSEQVSTLATGKIRHFPFLLSGLDQ